MFDLIIIGGSAAATAAGIYAARRGLNFKIITKDFGGEVATSGEIGNWPGISQTDGIILANQFKEHLKFYNVIPEEGVEVEKITKQEDPAQNNSVTEILGGGYSTPHPSDHQQERRTLGGASGTFLIKTKNGNDYVAKAVIVATGVHPKELNIPGEKEFRNKGVSYCTVCDGPLFSGKITAVIGGGNSALEAGLMLADIASKVYMINKNPDFKGEKILLDKLTAKKNVEIVYNAKTTQITGGQFVEVLKYDQAGEYEFKIDGIFVHIGMIPNSLIVPAEVQKNNFGEIIVNKNCETNMPGLYAAGDVTDVLFKQIVIAAGQGCTALLSAVQYLNKLK